MEKTKKAMKYAIVSFFFGMSGVAIVLFLVGAFRFVNSFIINETPGFIEWLGIIFVYLTTGLFGLLWYICDTEE